MKRIHAVIRCLLLNASALIYTFELLGVRSGVAKIVLPTYDIDGGSDTTDETLQRIIAKSMDGSIYGDIYDSQIVGYDVRRFVSLDSIHRKRHLEIVSSKNVR